MIGHFLESRHVLVYKPLYNGHKINIAFTKIEIATIIGKFEHSVNIIFRKTSLFVYN